MIIIYRTSANEDKVLDTKQGMKLPNKKLIYIYTHTPSTCLHTHTLTGTHVWTHMPCCFAETCQGRPNSREPRCLSCHGSGRWPRDQAQRPVFPSAPSGGHMLLPAVFGRQRKFAPGLQDLEFWRLLYHRFQSIQFLPVCSANIKLISARVYSYTQKEQTWLYFQMLLFPIFHSTRCSKWAGFKQHVIYFRRFIT